MGYGSSNIFKGWDKPKSTDSPPPKKDDSIIFSSYEGAWDTKEGSGWG